MAEAFPYYGPEFGEHKPDKDKESKETSKKEKVEGLFRAGGEAAKRPSIFEAFGANGAKDKAEKREKNLFQFGEAKHPESEARESERHESAQNPEMPEAAGMEPEKQSRLQRPTAEELAALAAQVEQANLEAMHHASLAAEAKDPDEDKAKEKSEKDKEDKPQDKKGDADLLAAAPAGKPEQSPASSEPFDAQLQRDMPAEFANATSGEQLSDMPPDASVAERLAHADKEFEDFAGERAEPTGLVSADFTEAPAHLSTGQTGPESFGTLAQHRPDLAERARQPEMAAASDPNERFNDIVQNSLGEDNPGPTRFQEQGPGEPPVEVGGGEAGNGPPSPPTVEGAEYGGEDPQNRHSAYGYDPFAPAGDMLNPATMAGLSALEARQELNSLHHSVRERSLAGAVGLLGLGLVVEHFLAKRRDKKLKRQLNKQNKALRETGHALQQEQVAHQGTRSRLERLATEQNATHEQLQHLQTHELPAANAAAGTGLISAAAAAELAARAGNKFEAPATQPATRQELARQLETSPELGRAIQRNPELQETFETGVPTTETGGQTAHELRELVGASAYADTLRHERNYEHLQTRAADAGQTRHGGVDGAGLPSLPQPQPISAATSQTPPPLSAPSAGRSASRSKLASPWAWATIAFIAAAALIIAFVS